MEVAVGLIWRDGCCFLQRRALTNPVLPGLWEFPGGKVEPGEAPDAALIRELAEEVGVTRAHLRAGPVHDGSPRFHPFQVESPETPRTALAWGWFTPTQLGRLPMPPANEDLVAALQRAGLLPPF